MDISIEAEAETVAIVTGIVGLVAWAMRVQWWLAQLDVRINTLWDFHLRRGAQEVAEKGLGRMNSPLVIDPGVMRAVDPDLAARLRSTYRRLSIRTTLRGAALERELAVQIQIQYGPELGEGLCLPYSVGEGAALVVAVAVAKGADPS